MNNRKRNVQIKFRVTEEERSLIEEKMKQVPTSNMEAYLRKMAIDGYIIQIDHSDIKKMTAELQKIGVNINQIAKRANATGNVYQEDIEEIKGALKEIGDALLCGRSFLFRLRLSDKLRNLLFLASCKLSFIFYAVFFLCFVL
ncbi:MobC family plasmid mobilization relaxosome protein [Streptococcus suis]|uniref:MobC family plasmid mobilization relaxosome protein n=1 Tax=Streptococcus suis TaxID=1307 RepID=UPI00193100A0|nr:MobC family plasmid mobilization relaxosome protein [Streptococcus suis]